jgi:hypothetical protein
MSKALALPSTEAAESPSTEQQRPQEVVQKDAAETAETSTASSAPEQSTPAPAPVAATSSRVEAFLAERAAKLEAQRKKDAEEAKRQRLEKGKAKAESESESTSGEKSKAVTSQAKHADALKRKQKEAREERQRILKQIEDDRAARKARLAERVAERQATLEAQAQEQAENSASPTQMSSITRASEHCSLQVRLFDGSTIRNRFPSQNRLGSDVRKWIDETRQDGSHPYQFKVLLTPLPNKTIDITEEDQSLQDLGLAPSSTLILQPVSKAVSASYPGAESQNPLSRLIAMIVAFVSQIWAVIFGFVTTLFSTAGPPQPETASPLVDTAAASGRDDGRIKGLQTSRDRRNDQQFYNGNSVGFTAILYRSSQIPSELHDANQGQYQTNFEPRGDEEEE